MRDVGSNVGLQRASSIDEVFLEPFEYATKLRLAPHRIKPVAFVIIDEAPLLRHPAAHRAARRYRPATAKWDRRCWRRQWQSEYVAHPAAECVGVPVRAGLMTSPAT